MREKAACRKSAALASGSNGLCAVVASMTKDYRGCGAVSPAAASKWASAGAARQMRQDCN